MDGEPLLSLRLTVDYPDRPGVLRGVTLEMQPGEILGLVGKSGSGKSTLALAILRLLETQGGRFRGEVRFRGRNLADLPEREMRRIRGRGIALVLQSPIASLNPALRIGKQLSEAWKAHPRNGSDDWPARRRETLERVQLPSDESFLRRYPAELSVGLAQRVLIGMAVLHRPQLLIADEPTSALDAITASEILALFRHLNQEYGIGVLYISHDLLSVASLCHRVAILDEGRIVECGKTQEIFRSPAHPYTQRLLEALPRPPHG